MKKCIVLLTVFMVSSKLLCVGGWNKTGYQPIATNDMSTEVMPEESDKSFMMKMKVLGLKPNEITFVRAIKMNDTSTINSYLNTQSFINAATPGLFQYAAKTAATQGNKKLEKKLLQFTQ